MLSAICGWLLFGAQLDIFVSIGCVGTILAIFNYTVRITNHSFNHTYTALLFNFCRSMQSIEQHYPLFFSFSYFFQIINYRFSCHFSLFVCLFSIYIAVGHNSTVNNGRPTSLLSFWHVTVMPFVNIYTTTPRTSSYTLRHNDRFSIWFLIL